MINKYKKILICLFILASFLFFIFNKTQNNQIEYIKKRGELLVGTTGDYQPMSYLDPETNKYVGFDIALSKDLAKSFGVNVKYIPTSWPTLMEDVTAKKFDLAICGITITDERKKQALMSESYMKNGKTVLCRKEDEKKYINLEAINNPNVRVMENPGGLNEKFAKEMLPKADLIIHNINQEIPNLVANKKADVMITEIVEAKFYSKKDKRLAAPIADFPFTECQMGILMPKGNTILLKYVNNFLKQERNSGRLNELENIYIYGNGKNN